VVSYDQYLLRDDPPTSAHNPVARWPGFETGLETDKGKKKPAFGGFRLPLVVTRTSAGVSFWGFVRPLGETGAGPAAPTGSSAATGSSGSSGSTGSTGSTGSHGASALRKVTLQYSSDGGRTWRTLANVHTNSAGAWSASGHFATHRLWRVKWVAASGAVYAGAPTRAYTTSGKIDY
jgi:hypothetical protein